LITPVRGRRRLRLRELISDRIQRVRSRRRKRVSGGQRRQLD